MEFDKSIHTVQELLEVLKEIPEEFRKITPVNAILDEDINDGTIRVSVDIFADDTVEGGLFAQMTIAGND